MMQLQVDGHICVHCTCNAAGEERNFGSRSACAGWPAESSELAVGGLIGSTPFQAVLASLVPRHQALDAVSLSSCQLIPAAFQARSALRSLTELTSAGCTSPDGGLDAALGALLPNTTQLQRLSVQRCLQLDDPFPESLRTLAGPTSLSLSDNSLMELPEGPCWAGGCELRSQQWPGMATF